MCTQVWLAEAMDAAEAALEDFQLRCEVQGLPRISWSALWLHEPQPRVTRFVKRSVAVRPPVPVAFDCGSTVGGAFTALLSDAAAATAARDLLGPGDFDPYAQFDADVLVPSSGWDHDDDDEDDDELVEEVAATHGEELLSEARAVLDGILESFRDEYRRAWNVPFVREVLAHISNIALPAPPDVAPEIGLAQSHGDALLTRSPVLRVLARRAYCEYQQQLVDPGCVEAAAVAEAADDAVAIARLNQKQSSASDDADTDVDADVYVFGSVDRADGMPKSVRTDSVFEEGFHMHRSVASGVSGVFHALSY